MQGTRLSGHQARTQAGTGGIGAVLFGLIFVAAGTPIILVSADIIEVSDSQFNAPRWVVGLIGAMFALAGVAVSISGLRGMARTRRSAAQLARHPDQPWLADHTWDPTGTSDSAARGMFGAFGGAIFMTLFMVPFNWVGLRGGLGAASWFWMGITGLFDLITIAVWGHAFYLTARAQKYGKSFLQFNGFPFTLGQQLNVSFSAPKGIGAFDKMSFIVRCVQERYETHGTGEDRKTTTVCYELYQDAITMDQRGIFEGGHTQVPLQFNLPADQSLGTELAARPPRYWELEVTAETPGVDFKATYLLPVYATQGSVSAEEPAADHQPVWS